MVGGGTKSYLKLYLRAGVWLTARDFMCEVLGSVPIVAINNEDENQLVSSY